MYGVHDGRTRPSIKRMVYSCLAGIVPDGAGVTGVGAQRLASAESFLSGSPVLCLFDLLKRLIGSGILALCDAVELGLLSMATKIASTLPDPSSASAIESSAGLLGGPGGGRGLLAFGLGFGAGVGRGCLVRSDFGGSSGGGGFSGGGAFAGGVAGVET